MSRNTRTLIVVGSAMLLATLASFGVYRTIQTMPVKQVPIVERYQVVASRPVSVGEVLAADMVTIIPWPADHAMPGGFTAPADVIGRGVTSALILNEPVTESKLAPRGAGGGMVTTIPNGMRAMSVRVNDVSGVAGFAVPGTRVDVVVTVRTERESLSRTVLSNIQVLTAGTKIETDRTTKEGQSIQTAVVTLLVTPNDGEKLALATTQGQIVLALRNPLDTVPTESNGAHMANLVGAASPAPVASGSGPARRMVQPTPEPPPPPPMLNAIRGTASKVEIIKSGGGGGK